MSVSNHLTTLMESLKVYLLISVPWACLLTWTYEAPLLIPLTSSLYVPGSLGNTDKVIVDVGTGYMVEKVNIISLQSFLKLSRTS
jgi:hypothetical protein